MQLLIKRLKHYPATELPAYQTSESAGLDLLAAIPDPLKLNPIERAAVPTGIALAIPFGFEGQVRPRSGLALRLGLGMVNAPGTIDADYRGEIKVILINLGSIPLVIMPGERIAQLVIAPVARPDMLEVSELPQTVRDSGGFGSTGV